jgi:hypothetical protein
MAEVSPNPAGSSAEAVRTAVEAADARRRRRELSVWLWRTAPVLAGGCLVVAAVNWWLRGSITVPIAVIGTAWIYLLVYVRMHGRRHAVSDAMASRIDADGAFNDELRSANWFAARGERDEWADFHLDRAAARLSDADWQALYPPVSAARPRVMTAALFVAAVGFGFMTPGRWQVEARGPLEVPVSGTALAPGKAMDLQMLPEDLRKQIEDLLASAENRTGSARQQTEAAKMIWNMFTALNSDINAEKLKEVAKAMDPTGRGSAAEAAKKLNELAGRSVKAADTRELPADLRDALNKLGEAMVSTAAAEDKMAQASGSQPPSSASGNDASESASDGAPNLDDASIQMSRDSDASAGAGMMMMSSQLKAVGNPSSGFGGAGSAGSKAAPGSAAMGLADALRKETVEASADTTGDNVLSETRRKTEHGQATVGFTRGASGTSDRSRATAPPPVPEDLRGNVQSFFNRKQ